MKVLLASPAQLQNDGTPLKTKKSFVIPLSVYLLAGLTPKNWDIEIINEYTTDVPFYQHYDLVGITASTIHSQRGFEIAREFRSHGVKVVMGGFHPTLFTDEVQQHCDAVVVGEAEMVWEQVLDDAINDRLLPRYQADDFHDLKGLPLPRFDLIDKKKYMNDIMPVESTRGCPFNCDFCSVTQFYGRRYRHRPIHDVIRDVKATGSIFFNFVDDNIAGKMVYAEQLFEAIVPLKVFWMSQASIGLADDERILALSARSGFRYVIIGIETLDESNLEAVGKRKVNRVEEYVAKTKLFKKYGISVAANMMFGFDNDTKETFEKTYHFLIENRFMPNPYILTPYPGTRMFDQMRDAGRLLHHDYWKYTSYQTVFKPAHMSPDKLDELFQDFYKRVYSVPNIIKRFFHMIRFKFSFGQIMTQLALALNSLSVRKNLHQGKLPYF